MTTHKNFSDAEERFHRETRFSDEDAKTTQELLGHHFLTNQPPNNAKPKNWAEYMNFVNERNHKRRYEEAIYDAGIFALAPTWDELSPAQKEKIREVNNTYSQSLIEFSENLVSTYTRDIGPSSPQKSLNFLENEVTQAIEEKFNAKIQNIGMICVGADKIYVYVYSENDPAGHRIGTVRRMFEGNPRVLVSQSSQPKAL